MLPVKFSMPFLLFLLALFLPRVVIVLLWFFTGWFQGIFTTIWMPLLGFLLLPYTLLWYSAVQHWFGGTWSLIPVIGLVIALIADIASWGSGRRK